MPRSDISLLSKTNIGLTPDSVQLIEARAKGFWWDAYPDENTARNVYETLQQAETNIHEESEGDNGKTS